MIIETIKIILAIVATAALWAMAIDISEINQKMGK